MRPRHVAGAAAGFATLFLPLLPGPALSQVYTHPAELEMAEPRDPRPDPAAFRVELESGIPAYVVPDATVPLVTFSVFVDAGRADGAPGAAHVLGSVLRAAAREASRDLLGEVSLTVGPEEIELTIDVPAEHGREAVGILAGFLRAPPLSGADLSSHLSGTARRAPSEEAAGESGPVLYEGSLDSAVRLFQDHLLAGTAYAPSLPRESAAALTEAHVREFHRRWVPEGRLVLALSGDVERPEGERWLREAFVGFPTASAAAPRREIPEATDAWASRWEPRTGVLFPVEKLHGWVVLGHELPPVPREDEAALLVMNYILGGGHFDARLFIEVRDKRGLANTAGAFPEWHRAGPGTYTFRTYGRPESVALLVRILQDEIARIREHPVTDEELRVARGAYVEGEYGMWFHDGASTARALALEWLRTGGHEGTASFRDRIRAVTAADVQRAARRYLNPDRLRMVLVGPLEEIRAVPPLDGAPPLGDFGRLVEGA